MGVFFGPLLINPNESKGRRRQKNKLDGVFFFKASSRWPIIIILTFGLRLHLNILQMLRTELYMLN